MSVLCLTIKDSCLLRRSESKFLLYLNRLYQKMLKKSTSHTIDWTTIEFTSSETLVGSWIDGKPVYQRTSTIPMAAANTWYYGDYTNNIKQIVFLDGVIVTGSGGVFPLNNSNSTVAIAFDPNDTTHKAPQVRTSSTGIFPATVYLQFKYTKTTD